MYEERERFSWTSLFIKIIIVIIFVLFTIWLLQLTVKSANKDMSNGINVLTDNIFSQNIDKMKEVGKSYFTTERLPQKIGEVKTLTLEDMYKKNLILEVKDKNGKACSAKKSYVAIEKLETEYQMKVYLECGEEHNFIKVIMGCYNYCNTDICEKKEIPSNKAIEYEYSKTTGGAWGPWGNWTNWSTVEVSKTDRRDVETKTIVEPYTYEETTTKEEYVGVANVCASISGYTLVSDKDGVCSYKETNPATTNPTCPSLSGYTLTSRNGFTCNYKQTNPATTNPTCPTISGYTNTGRSGFTCSYKETNPATTEPVCPELTGYNKPVRNGFTCSYSRSVQSTTEYELVYYGTGSGSYIPADTTTYHYVQDSADYQYMCNNTCAFQWYYIYKIYTKKYKTVTETTTREATCPNGYSQSGNSCVAAAKTTTKSATCPAGQNQKGTKCYKNVTTTITVEDTRKVTYYRYRLRDYNGGTVDYKWSPSNNDKSLLDAGYKLTGKTREVGGK